MLNRFRLVASLFLLVATAASAVPEVIFNGETYRKAWFTKEGTVELTEFLPPGESLASWTQMLSIQIHPDARRIADVMNPYAAARKSMYAADPQIYKKSGGAHAEEAIFEFLLLAPDKSHFEFVLVRALSDRGQPVILYVFSRRIPLADKAKAAADLAQIKAKRSDLLQALDQITLPPDIRPPS